MFIYKVKGKKKKPVSYENLAWTKWRPLCLLLCPGGRRALLKARGHRAQALLAPAPQHPFQMGCT